MSSSADPEVVIVGAGPAGSALATRLASAGIRVLLLDRAEFPRPKPCAEYLTPATLAHLVGLGVLEAVEPMGHPLEATTVVGPYGARLTGRFAGAHPPPFRPTGLSIPREVLDAELVRRAREAGAELATGIRVTDLVVTRGQVTGVVAQDRSGRPVSRTARLVVGADGLRSIVALRLGGRRHGVPRRLAFVAHLHGIADLDGTTEMHVGRTGYAGLNPMPAGIANVALVVPASRVGEAAGDREGFFRRGLAEFAGLRDRLAGATLTSAVTVTGPFAARARRVVANGALLVGDAADFFDPFTGEGIGAALRGAELAEGPILDALRDGPVTATALRPYLRARRRAFAGKWAVERLVGFGMLAPALFDRAVGRLHRRGLADTFLGVTGGLVPARAVLNPGFLTRMVF